MIKEKFRNAQINKEQKNTKAKKKHKITTKTGKKTFTSKHTQILNKQDHTSENPYVGVFLYFDYFAHYTWNLLYALYSTHFKIYG